jgi:hypothetical protein
VSALGHYLEQEGIATVSISLIREHTAALNPPRALWVPFMLGRPLGVPNDPVFQHKVLWAALSLLEHDAGPVLVDFPEEAPYEDLGAEPQGLICPVSFPRKRSEGTLGERLADEIGQLHAWHDLAVKFHGRTTLGLTGLAPGKLGAFLVAWLEDQALDSFGEGFGTAADIKRAADELKAFYYEAKSVQPGRHSPTDMQNWFWMETTAGEVLLNVREKAKLSTDRTMKGIATLAVVPRGVSIIELEKK